MMKIQVPDNSLWQYIEKDHIDPTIRKNIWAEFVLSHQDEFAEKVSEMVQNMWTDYDPNQWENKQ